MRRCFLEGGKNLNNSFTFFMKLVLKMYFIDKFSSFSSNYYDNFFEKIKEESCLGAR